MNLKCDSKINSNPFQGTISPVNTTVMAFYILVTRVTNEDATLNRKMEDATVN